MLSILLGSRQWDAASYVRHRVEDIAGIFVSDNDLLAYVDAANEDFSRFVPLDGIVGGLNSRGSYSSPLVTVAYQQRYLLTSANGFASNPIFVKYVGYMGSSGEFQIQAQNEWSITQMNLGNLDLAQVSLDSPASRVLRDAQLDELARFGQSFFSFVTDEATGSPALDIYPTPQSGGIPIVVRYQAEHPIIPVNSADAITIPSIPAGKCRDWGKLLLLEVLDQFSGRMISNKVLHAGLVEIESDTKVMEQRIYRIKEDVHASLGMYTGAGLSAN